MAKQSFFAEKRAINNNPNFFNFMTIDEIRRSVKRIITDIKYNNIVDQDYSYFINPNVTSACLTESYAQYQTASVLVNALNFYINDSLKFGMLPSKSADINSERAIATSELIRQTTKCYVWMQIYLMFKSITNGAEIISTLKTIQDMQFNIRDL